MLKRLFILVVMLCALAFVHTERTRAEDAGGACLGQWSECRTRCEGQSNQLWVERCNTKCDVQRDMCLNGTGMADGLGGEFIFGID